MVSVCKELSWCRPDKTHTEQCILHLGMEQDPGPKPTAADRHWIILLVPMGKANVY